MLKIATKMREISFGRLMEVYRESCKENAEDFWPQETPERQLALAEQDFYDYLSCSFFTTEGALYAIWQVDDRYVSALRLEPYRDGWLLEALETAPDHRRRGYARTLLQAVLDRYPGRKIYSHVSKKNVPSLKTHEACGFRRILEYAVYIDGSVNDRCCTFCHE